MKQHTPGPWAFMPGKDHHDNVFTVSRPHRRVASVFAAGEVDDENTANARLIAAAPELFEACKAAMRILALWGGNDCPEDSHLFEENRALFMMQNAFEMAISKAEGK